MKDKWLKFFTTQMPPEMDQNRSLRNKFTPMMLVYIEDKYMTFTDLNLIRAYDAINYFNHFRIIKM